MSTSKVAAAIILVGLTAVVTAQDGQSPSVRAAAAQQFAKGRLFFLHSLTPNPLVASASGTSQISVRFIRAGTSAASVRNFRLAAAIPSQQSRAKLAGTLPSPPQITGDGEGTITFEVNAQLWTPGGPLDTSAPLELTLVDSAGTPVSNPVHLKLIVK